MAQKSILIVDDEKVLLDLFSMALRRLPYTVLTAISGREALDIFETETPVLVLLDLAMPEVNGIEVLRHMRNTPTLAGVKVIILTAVPVMLDSTTAGMADEVLAKPIKMRDLELAVERVLASA
jgi:CheY-like chemotaxis protein